MAHVSYARRIADHAAQRPDRLAVTDTERSVTWAEFDALATATARALQELGVGTGSFVTVMLPNSIEFLATTVACWKLGATPQPISFMAPPREARAIVDLADSVVVVGADPADFPDRTVLPKEWAPRPDHYEGAPLADATSDPWKAMTSGGSTGRPKLILVGSAGTIDPDARPMLMISPDGALLMPGPLYHNGPFIWSTTALLAGCHVVIGGRFDARTTLELVERHRCDVVYLVPTMMQRIWRLPEDVRTGFDVSSLRAVWHLAAPCPAWLKHAWIEWLGADTIFELYAGTEAQASTVITGREWLEHRGSVGRVTSGAMRIVDPDGNPLPPGEIGEVFMRAPDPTTPTYRYVGAEARTLGDGWESLGDMGYLDADGYLYLADRKADMLLVGGANVYPAEIEAAIEEHPLVESAVVVGLPDDDLGQRPHAIVHTTAEVSDDDLRAHLQDRIVRYKIPRSFERSSQPLRDDAGKVRRSALAEARHTPNGHDS